MCAARRPVSTHTISPRRYGRRDLDLRRERLGPRRNAPSRWRLRPAFRLTAAEAAADRRAINLVRSVLGASRTLGGLDAAVKEPWRRTFANCDLFFSHRPDLRINPRALLCEEEKTAGHEGPAAKEFAEPGTLSSTFPTNLPLPRSAPRGASSYRRPVLGAGRNLGEGTGPIKGCCERKFSLFARTSSSRVSAMRDQARAVVVGGGVGGCSILYWLARLGWDDVVLVERAELTSGSTFHSAGLVGQLRSSLALTQMMRESVDLYRSLEAEVGLETGWHEVGSLRLASSPERMEEIARQVSWANTFGLPLELVSPRRGRGAVPADDDGRRARRSVPPDRWLHRSEPAHVRARRGRAPARGGDRDRHAGHRLRRRARADQPGRDRARQHRDRRRRQRRRDVRAGARRARRRERPDRPDGARVPRDEAGRASARHADNARPVAARLLPARVGRPDHGRLRAPLCSLGPRRHPTRLQLAAPRGGLASLRGAHGERPRPRPLARRDGGREAHQRARGVHAGRGVHPRADRRARILGGRRVLRARARRGRRHGQARRRVDRRGHAVARRLGDGLPPLRRGIHEPGVHARAHEGDLRDVLRREVPGPRARRRPPAPRLARLRAAAGARRGIRREVGLGAGELVRAERRARRRVAAARRLGREALVARDRRRARRVPRVGGALRRDVLREARGERSRSRSVPRAPLREPGRARRGADHVHADVESARRHRVRPDGDAPCRGSLPPRHGNCLRATRPRLAPAARARGWLGRRLRRHVAARLLRLCGAPMRARSSSR